MQITYQEMEFLGLGTMASAAWGPNGPIDMPRVIAEGDEILVRVRVLHVYPGEGYVQVRFQSPHHDGSHCCPVRVSDILGTTNASEAP